MIEFKVRERTREIIVHDSHTAPSIERAVNVLRWQGRKMGLLDIGYHFVIDRDGHEDETRAQAVIGSALRGHDLQAVHICLIGGRGEDGQPEDNFTTEQRIALFDRVRNLKRQYGPVPLLGHDEAVHGRQRGEHHRIICPALDMADLRHDYWAYVQTKGSLT